MKTLRRFLILMAFAILVTGIGGPAQSEEGCNTVSYSRAINYFYGQGWCEGDWYSHCTYCWDTEGGGATCSSNYGICGPENRN